MAKKVVTGPCHICGIEGPLTEEHVPPKAAFNNMRFIRVDFDQMMTLGPDEEVKGKIEQGGVRNYTLCGRCNNDTGSWYGKAFVAWCYQAASIIEASHGKPSLIHLYHAFPLRIIKQIATMFFSVNADGFAKNHQELVEFVLNKDRRFLSPRYRFYVYYNTEGRYRYSATCGKFSIDTGTMNVFSEITYPPFGYVMTLYSPSPDKRLFDITHFVRYGYNEFRDVEVYPPMLPTHLTLPGDYRTKSEIYHARESNEEFLANNQVLVVRENDCHL